MPEVFEHLNFFNFCFTLQLLEFEQVHFYHLLMFLKLQEWQTKQIAGSHLSLHCLLRHVCPNTYRKYRSKTITVEEGQGGVALITSVLHGHNLTLLVLLGQIGLSKQCGI